MHLVFSIKNNTTVVKKDLPFIGPSQGQATVKLSSLVQCSDQLINLRGGKGYLLFPHVVSSLIISHTRPQMNVSGSIEKAAVQSYCIISDFHRCSFFQAT